MKKIFLYGAGKIADWYINNYGFELNETELIGIIETDKSTEEWGDIGYIR